MIKNIIIILLVLIIIYLNIDKFHKFYKNIKKEYYTSKQLNIKVDLTSYLKEQAIIQKAINENINDLIKDKKLREILYYVLSDGKKVRPIIFTSIYKNLTKSTTTPNITPNYALKCAMAIEYIHTASLIIDDIMDDDDYRRGKMALHVKYNLSIAQLAAILLFSIGMENIFNGLDELIKIHQDTNKDIPLIIGKLYSGILRELTIGQYYDITALPENSDKIKGIETIIHKKTSTLFEFSFIVPYILANHNKSTPEIDEGMKKMSKIARYFGLMFQISDDFEDYLQDSERENNTINEDDAVPMNYVIHLGYYDAYNEYNKIVSDFNLSASNENVLTKEISEIEGYLTKKVKVYYDDHRKIDL